MMNWATNAPDDEQVIINVPDKSGMLARIAAHLFERTGFSIATLNIDHTVKLRLNPEFRNAYARQTYVVADGNPVVWLSRLSGQEIELVPGSELIEPVMELAAAESVPIAFLGSTEEALARTAQAARVRYPGLEIAAEIAPPMGFDPTGAGALEAIETLKGSGARIVFLALGAPKQEVFAAFAQEHLPGMGFLSIGAGLDFIAGTQTRAPFWVRRLALEWLWRLCLSPARLAKRYAACFAILPRLTISALRARRVAKAEVA